MRATRYHGDVSAAVVGTVRGPRVDGTFVTARTATFTSTATDPVGETLVGWDDGVLCTNCWQPIPTEDLPMSKLNEAQRINLRVRHQECVVGQ